MQTRSASKLAQDKRQALGKSKSVLKTFYRSSSLIRTEYSLPEDDEIRPSLIVIANGDEQRTKHILPLPNTGDWKIRRGSVVKNSQAQDSPRPSIMRNAYRSRAGSTSSLASLDSIGSRVSTSSSLSEQGITLEQYASSYLDMSITALYIRARDPEDDQAPVFRVPRAPRLKVVRLRQEEELKGGMLVCACIDGDTDPPPISMFEEAVVPRCSVI